MQILIQGTVFENDRQRGIRRYFYELVKRVGLHYQIDIVLNNPAVAELPPNCTVVPRKEWHLASPRNYPLRAWRKFRRRFAPTELKGHTLFHPSFFTPSPVAHIPQVVTVYDMIAEKYEPHNLRGRESHIEDKRRSMEAARKIICISESTAKDVKELYPDFADKVCVIYLGTEHLLEKAAPALAQRLGDPSGSARPYLLHVGERASYKNFGLILSAMSEPSWPAELQVVVAGAMPSRDELEVIHRLGLTSRIGFVGRASDRELKDLYLASTGFVFPSLYEGFGLPLFEAQSLGTPVLCSDIPVFRETGGDSPLFFDARDPSALANAAQRLMNMGTAYDRESGLRNVQRFRWDDCATMTSEVYRTVSADDRGSSV
jgi:glycosyltransferase involved in cell wall biosynthesis